MHSRHGADGDDFKAPRGLDFVAAASFPQSAYNQPPMCRSASAVSAAIQAGSSFRQGTT
jgi:hypothetical protein